MMGDANEHQKEEIDPVEESGSGKPENEQPVAESAEDDGKSKTGQDEQPPSGEGFANPLEALAAENHQLEEQVAGLNDKLLRAAAEMENLRRRTQKDVADARNFSISGFARDLLAVSDNLRRAIEAVAEEDQDHPGLKSLVEGVEMTEREFHKTLEKNGVRKISPLNEKFDPNFHQAMFEVANPEVPNNTVTEVVQDGYVIGDRVLRPAMVGIAKGGPKQHQAATQEPDQSVKGEAS